MSKTKIELRPLLPNVTEPNDACFRRLIVLLESKAGVNSAHISGSEEGHPERICIHFNSEMVSLGEVRELAKRAGVEINNRYGHWLGQSTAMHAGRASAIESRLQRIAGVIEAAVSPEGAVRVEYDRQLTNDKAIADALKKWTRGVSEASDESEASDGHAGHLHGEEGPEEDHGHAGHKLANGDHAHGGIFGPKSELIFAILCGVFLLVGWLKFTKKFERYFVPSVIGGVILLLFAPLVLDEAFNKSFYRAMAVLVAASPCALAISTPSAVLSGVARAARGGILIKGGGPLESLGSLDSIAFDKTGTLTEGEPKVTDVRTAEGVNETELLRIVIAVETLSKHPLARAIERDGKKKLGDDGSGDRAEIPPASDLISITGRGIQALVEGDLVHVGKDDLFAEVQGPPLPDAVRAIVESLEQNGRTTMIVRRAERYLGVIGLMDTPREPSKRTISRLRELGIKRMIMISGDNQKVADAVAKEVGLDEARGDLMPEDKVAEIKKLKSEGGVAMVGDGVNDAPAMASASVGIAMGAAGSDVALETADVALMADNLDHLPLAIGLSRATRRIIRQNLLMSLGMVVFLVPATILGLNIGPAVALHEGSTLVVVFNALRLLAYRER